MQTTLSVHPFAGEKEDVWLFQQLSAGEHSRLTRLLHSLQLAANQAVYQQQALATSLYIVKTGTVALQRRSPEGKVDRLAIVNQGHSCGRASLAAEQSRHAESAVTLEPCLLLALLRQDMLLLAEKEPGLILKILRAVQEESYREWLLAAAEFHALTSRLTEANILL